MAIQQKLKTKSILRPVYLVYTLLALMLISCASYKQFQYITEEFRIPTKMFKTTFNETWQVILPIMKRYELAEQSIEAGMIKTRWIDNTVELNFNDSFGKSDTIKAAKFKLIINVVKGFRSGREVSKVTIFKRQMVEPDFLQGWKVLRSDGILEKTILYRIARSLAIEKKRKELEDSKTDEKLNDF